MFESVLDWLHHLVGNYGVAVILFTLLVRIVLFPFDYKSRKSMRKTAALQPKMAVLQKKYANDREKLNRKMQELYKQEGVSPLSGCLPMLLSYPILIIMFNAMRSYANQQMAQQVLTMMTDPALTIENVKLDSFLWIKNLYMADSPVVSCLADFNTMRSFGAEIWTKVATPELIGQITGAYNNQQIVSVLQSDVFRTNLAAFGITDKAALLRAIGQVNSAWLTPDSYSVINLNNTLGQMNMLLQATPVYQANVNLQDLPLVGAIKALYNGFWILPVMSAVSQLVMTKLTPTQTQPAPANDPQAQSQQATGKFMKWFFPIFSLWICATSTAAFALYWVASNVIAMGSTVAVNKYLDKKEQKDAIAGEGIVQ